MVLVGKEAPLFVASAVQKGVINEKFSLHSLRGKIVILLFYPLDFTFVCPTELLAFNEALEQFKALGAEVVSCSVDSPFSHMAWLEKPRSEGGIEGVSFPMISDIHRTIATSYGVFREAEGIAQRALFLIDKHGIVRHQSVNDLGIGRSVEETLRLVEAVIHVEKHGDVCPANWKKGNPAMKPNAQGLRSFSQEHFKQ